MKLGLFFSKYKCAEESYGLIDTYIAAADRYNLDWRLLPGISVIESSCLRRYPRALHNPFGWASARVGFESLPAGVDYVSRQLSEGRYYAGKTVEEKLKVYNPPSVNPDYAPTVLRLMNEISPKP